MPPIAFGFGGEPWGSGPWGGSFSSSLSASLTLLSALATAENVVTIGFNDVVYFSQLLDVDDASDPSKYSIAPVAGTSGYDGTTTRNVAVATVALSTDNLPVGAASGSFLDLTLDRAMTPYPAAYSLTVSNVFLADQSAPLAPNPTTIAFPAVFKQLTQQAVDTSTPSRDVANPQTLSAASDPLPNPFNAAALGTFGVDDTGDYAFDQGLVAVKKRIYRRLVTNPGGFVHLGDGYGVGIPAQTKRLATNAVRSRLAAQAEAQIALEPEVDAVRVTTLTDPLGSGLVRFVILVRLRSGVSTKFSAAFPTAA